MRCTNCGRPYKPRKTKTYCPYCLNDTPGEVTKDEQSDSKTEKELLRDNPRFIFLLLSALFPIVGIIFLFKTAKVKPISFRKYLMATGVGISIRLFFWILFLMNGGIYYLKYALNQLGAFLPML